MGACVCSSVGTTDSFLTVSRSQKASMWEQRKLEGGPRPHSSAGVERLLLPTPVIKYSPSVESQHLSFPTCKKSSVIVAFSSFHQRIRCPQKLGLGHYNPG